MNCCDLLCEANSKRSDQLKSNDFLKFVFGGISDLYTRTIRFQIGKKKFGLRNLKLKDLAGLL